MVSTACLHHQGLEFDSGFRLWGGMYILHYGAQVRNVIKTCYFDLIGEFLDSHKGKLHL